MLSKKQEETFRSAYTLQQRVPPFPKSIMLESTNHCNFACHFCSHSKMTRKKTYIDTQLAHKSLKEAYAYGSRDVGFNGCGEQILHPHLADFIKYAKDIGYTYTYLTTNGSVGSHKRFANIFNAGLDSIKFSYNYLDRHKDFLQIASIRQNVLHTQLGRKFYEKVVSNIRRAIRYKQENRSSLKVYISCVSSQPKDAVLETLNGLFEGIDEILHYPLVSQAGQTSDVSLLTAKTNLMGGPLFCLWPFNKMRITSEGYVNACCVDFQNFLAMGDANKENLKDIWENSFYQMLREKIMNKDFTNLLCDGCLHNTYKTAHSIRPEFASLPQL